MSTSDNHTPPPKSYLLLENQGQFLRVFITKPRVFLGQAEDNDIVIREVGVLPRHAEIFFSGNQYNLVTVAGGQSRVNGKEAEGVHTLTNGDHLQVGNTHIMYVEEKRQSDIALHLIVRRKDELPFGVTITKPVVRIGRMKGDVLIEDDNLSPTHTIIENFCSDAIFVMDAKSKSGTWLNDAKLTGRRRLRSGDALSLGNTQISVLYTLPTQAQVANEASKIEAAPIKSVEFPVNAPPGPRPSAPPPHGVESNRHSDQYVASDSAHTEPLSRQNALIRPPDNQPQPGSRHRTVESGSTPTPKRRFAEDEAIPLPDYAHQRESVVRARSSSGLTQAVPLDMGRPKVSRPQTANTYDPQGHQLAHQGTTDLDTDQPDRRDLQNPTAAQRTRLRRNDPSLRQDDHYYYLPPDDEEWTGNPSANHAVAEQQPDYDIQGDSSRRGLTQGIPVGAVLRKRPLAPADSNSNASRDDGSGQYYHPDDKPRRK